MIYMAAYEPADRVCGAADRSWERGSRLLNREREHVLGRKLLDFGLEKEYGRTWKVAAADGAKPYLEGEPGICFNISHTKGLAACAVSRRPVGVDVEYIRPFRENLMRRICSAEEQRYVAEGDMSADERFFRLWTLKESFVKATGQGLRFPLRDVTFSREGTNIKGSIPGWHFYQARVCLRIQAVPGVYESYIISVCEADQEGEAV